MENNIKILKLYPKCDVKSRYNYHINYGVWDEIEGDRKVLEDFNSSLNNYDVVFLPMFKRWKNHPKLLTQIKSSQVKTVLFDNDSCYRTFDNSFYKDIDLILYRDLDQNKQKPKTNSMWHPWSVDPILYTPKYGGEGIVFNCTVNSSYPLRKKINTIITHKSYKGKDYISSLQSHGASIHTDSDLVPRVRAKALEIAACGTQIISNKTAKMDYFFPDDLVIYFDSIEELKEIIKNYQPDIKIQKELRNIVETKHTTQIRATEILNKIKEII